MQTIKLNKLKDILQQEISRLTHELHTTPDSQDTIKDKDEYISGLFIDLRLLDNLHRKRNHLDLSVEALSDRYPFIISYI